MRDRARFTVLLFAVLFLCLTEMPGAGASPPQTASKSHVPPPEARIDINHATIDELLRVPGMTRSWAGRIIRFRPYRVKDDLVERGVVTGEVYDRIKDYVIAHRDPQ